MAESLPTQSKRRGSDWALLVVAGVSMVLAFVSGPVLGEWAKGTYYLVLCFFLAWIEDLPEGSSS